VNKPAKINIKTKRKDLKYGKEPLEENYDLKHTDFNIVRFPQVNPIDFKVADYKKSSQIKLQNY